MTETADTTKTADLQLEHTKNFLCATNRRRSEIVSTWRGEYGTNHKQNIPAIKRSWIETQVGRESPSHYHLLEGSSWASTNFTAHSFCILGLELDSKI